MKHLFSLAITLLITISSNAATYDEEAWRASYIRYGEQYLGKPWAALPVSEFSRFKKDGNRTGYEALCFERRRQLAALVMAEIQERKGRFMPDIIDGIGVMLEEPWWGIPAHYGTPFPLYERQTVDLFNAESASLLAWTGKMLRSELDRFSPELYKKITREIDHRILKPALGSNDWWKRAGMNWNPWICSNWLTCVMLYEQDAKRRQQAVTEIEGCMKAFIDSYPEDGGCDEGTSYWDRAAASLFECLHLLKAMERDSLATVTMTAYQPEKVRRMGSYIYYMYIAGGYCVNFADAHENKSVAQLNVLYPFALYLQDPAMRQFAAYIAQAGGFWTDPASLYDKSGNFPTLGRELMLHSALPQLLAEQPREPQAECWLPHLQIKTMRSTNQRGFEFSEGSENSENSKPKTKNSKPKTQNQKFVAIKGGTNGESHNHNDVGSFIVYADGEPLLIDPGVGEYTSQTFGGSRYSIWTMQSGYHNLPQINGYDQRDGKQYHAQVTAHTRHSLTLDIAKAYPAEANVNSWQRTVSLRGSEVTLRERYDLAAITAPTRFMFLTTTKPTPLPGGRVTLRNHTITYPTAMTVEVEDLASLSDPIIRHMWGPTLYRIIFTLNPTKTKGEVTFRIK